MDESAWSEWTVRFFQLKRQYSVKLNEHLTVSVLQGYDFRTELMTAQFVTIVSMFLDSELREEEAVHKKASPQNL